MIELKSKTPWSKTRLVPPICGIYGEASYEHNLGNNLGYAVSIRKNGGLFPVNKLYSYSELMEKHKGVRNSKYLTEFHDNHIIDPIFKVIDSNGFIVRGFVESTVPEYWVYGEKFTYANEFNVKELDTGKLLYNISFREISRSFRKFFNFSKHPKLNRVMLTDILIMNFFSKVKDEITETIEMEKIGEIEPTSEKMLIYTKKYSDFYDSEKEMENHVWVNDSSSLLVSSGPGTYSMYHYLDETSKNEAWLLSLVDKKELEDYENASK